MIHIRCPECHAEMFEVESEKQARIFVCEFCGDEETPLFTGGKIKEIEDGN